MWLPWVCVCACVYICLYLWVCIHMCACVCMRVCVRGPSPLPLLASDWAPAPAVWVMPLIRVALSPVPASCGHAYSWFRAAMSVQPPSARGPPGSPILLESYRNHCPASGDGTVGHCNKAKGTVSEPIFICAVQTHPNTTCQHTCLSAGSSTTFNTKYEIIF